MADGVRFIRKGGRVIPIHEGSGQGRKPRQANPEAPIKGNKLALAAAGVLSVAGGIAAGASFAGGAKTALLVHGATFATDAASTSLGLAAFAGKGHMKARAKAAAKTEIKNQIIGWGTYAAAALASKAGRKAGASLVSKLGFIARKALKAP